MSALPPGWSEHIGPNAQPYYYNSATRQSTFTRPVGDKPLYKTPIPGHPDWIRVKTTGGKVFYFNKTKKESVWTVPDEIRDGVKDLEETEKKRLDDEQMKEVEKIKSQVEELVKRKADDAAEDNSVISKKAKLDEEQSDSEEEDWEKEAAAQLAAEAKLAEDKRERARLEAEEQARQLNLDSTDLSVEEGKALFKTLLREKDVNPLHPWDTSLPLFISDPRYSLLPSLSVRREAFDEYCRERARELRELHVQHERVVADPREEYDRLLAVEVKSTRTSWSDFRRTWKKDRRFYGWGRDDREREKRFKEHLKELGEKKRAAAQKAEADFFALLREHRVDEIRPVWKEFKNRLSKDPRYDAVGSSSLREELFNVFLKGTGSSPSLSQETGKPAQMLETREERKERAVREREEKVRAERLRVEASIGQSKGQLSRAEDEMQFMTMLTDAIRDAQLTWDEAAQELKSDPRFTNSSLPLNQQMHLFHTHMGHLRAKHYESMYSLFETHAPSLATQFSSLPLPNLLSSMPVTRLGLDVNGLEREFSKWQRERTQKARTAFDAMMSENSFVEFWGRLGKIGGDGVDGGVKADDMGEDEGEGGGGRVDMKALAKSLDLSDMQKVLKNDKRYTMFDHIPEQRERWIRDYVENLAAPKLSVHVS